jgi:hypothetical protein
MKECFSIYFAGDLFDHKHLAGNALLAGYIEKRSSGLYQCALPQDFEQSVSRRVSIRNQDLRMVMESDLALFNFDGADLDSGTVVEFMVAKQLDIPAVLLRTDFRKAGDQSADGDSWNLMCSNYPRTETVRVNGMTHYQQARTDNLEKTISSIYDNLAEIVIAALDKVRIQSPIGDATQITDQYRWTTRYCGAGMEELLDDPQWLQQLLDRKRNKGLIR